MMKVRSNGGNWAAGCIRRKWNDSGIASAIDILIGHSYMVG